MCCHALSWVSVLGTSSTVGTPISLNWSPLFDSCFPNKYRSRIPPFLWHVHYSIVAFVSVRLSFASHSFSWLVLACVPELARSRWFAMTLLVMKEWIIDRLPPTQRGSHRMRFDAQLSIYLYRDSPMNLNTITLDVRR